MKSSTADQSDVDYRGGSSSTIGQEDPVPIFLRRLNDLNVRVGTRTRLLIELDDATGVQVRWYHNNVEADSDRYQCIHEGGFYCLDIVPVTLDDEGLWVCTAQNYAGKTSTAARLSLIVPKAFKKPTFVEPLRAALTQRGVVSLECKVVGVPTPKLRWFKDDKEIKAGDIFALTATAGDECLGVYACEATNVMGSAVSTSKIRVSRAAQPDADHWNADSLIPYGPAPKFVKNLKDMAGKVGNVLFLECQVEVPPWPRSVGWYNDNGIVNESPLYHLLSDGLGMYGVEIQALRADHSTTWKCVVTSSTGVKAITSCLVTVSYPKNYRVPRFLESLRAIMTDEGLVSFECKVIGYPTPELSWFKDGNQLQPGDVYELTGSKSLGTYCCVARNCMGEASSVAELTVEDIQSQLNESEKLQLTSNTQPPRFLLGLKSTEANINEPFVFTVKVVPEPRPSISWYKEDEELTDSDRHQLSSDGNGTFLLNVVPLEVDDQAEWKCVAVNKYGQTVTSSFLKLNVPKNFKPPRFLDELRIAFSNEGSVNLECKVIGVPQPQLKWFKDGQELNPGDMHKIISGQSGTCCLGTYTCQAHNCMGTVSSSATLLTMEDKSTVKSGAPDEYLSVGNPLVRNESLSTIPEERTSQMEKSYTIEEPADVSFSFDGKEVTVSLYETPDLTHDEALQIIEMYADELSEHISEDNVVDLPSLRIVKESSISGPVMMEALVIDVPVGFCHQKTVSDTEFDGVSLTEDTTIENNDDSICEHSFDYFSDHLSSSNSKKDVFFSASETTPKHSSLIMKPKSEDDGGHTSFNTPKLFMSNSDDQVLTQLNLNEKQQHVPHTSRNVVVRSESNNDTEEEVSETLAEVENEPSLPHNYCAAEILTQSDEDGLYSTVLNKLRNKEMPLSSEEDDILKIISRPNVDEFLKYMKIILEGTMVKMHTHENFIYSDTPTELERSIQALHCLAWKFIEETERDNVTELDKNTTNNVSSLMTAINASLLALEQIDDPFGVSDNILNEIQSSICFDLETLNNKDMPATEILDRLSNQIKSFTVVVNRHVARVTEQRIIAVLRNTISTTLLYIKTLQQNCNKIKNININALEPLFSMIQPLDTILEDISLNEEASIDDVKPNLKLKQMLIPPISSIAFSLDNLNKELKNEYSEDDPDLKDIYDRINDSANQFMVLASQGTEGNNLAECFISFTKPINDLCCYLRRIGRSSENIVSSDYGSDDKLLLDFETIFDELMMDIDTLINNVNVVRDSDNNINPLGSLLEPLQDIKIGLFQVNQVLLSNQTGSNMSFEVISCFEYLSHQFVQLNNCITNQSIIEETNKEMPFESSIKMMQNILFNDAIDDLGVNGILFGSVMKPLLQLQNLIVSKMASVESDLSFSEHTDHTGGASQSLSLSLSNNAQTVFDKVNNDNLKQETAELISTDKKTGDIDKDNDLLYTNTSKTIGDFTPLEDAARNNLTIKRGFECDIGEAFRDEEPNIITSEDDRENSGFEVLFDETDLETASDFVEDDYSDNLIHPKADNNLLDSNINEKNDNFVNSENYDYIPECVLETHIKQSFKQDSMLSSPSDLLDELQETLKNISEITQDTTKEIYSLDDVTLKVIQQPQTVDGLDGETNKPLIGTLEVDTTDNLTPQTPNNLIMKDRFGVSEENTEISKYGNTVIEINQDEIINEIEESTLAENTLKIDQNDQTSEINQKIDSIDSNKSDISKDTVIKINEISVEDCISEKENTINKNEYLNMKNQDKSLDLVEPQNLVETVDFSEDVFHETETAHNLKDEDNPINVEIGNSDKISSQSDVILIKNIDNLPIDSNETCKLNDYEITNEENNFTKVTEIETQTLQNSSDHQVQAEINEQQLSKDEYGLEPNTTAVIMVEHKNGSEKETDLVTEEMEVPSNGNIIIKTKSDDDNDLQLQVIDSIKEIIKDSEQIKSSQEIDLKTVVENEPSNEPSNKPSNEEQHDLNASNKTSDDNKQSEVELNINRNNTEEVFDDDLQEKESITSVTLSTQTNVLNSPLASDNDQDIKIELNTSQTESQVPNILDQSVDEKNVLIDDNGITKTELLTNIDENPEIIQQTPGENLDNTNLINIDMETIEELNKQNKNLSNIHENSNDEKIDVDKLISIEVVDNKNVDEERVLDIPTVVENISTTKRDGIESDECKSQDNKASTSITDLEVLDEQVEQQIDANEIISKTNKPLNAEENKNKVIHLESNENTTLNQDTSVEEHVQNELENTKVNELKSTSESILSKEETDFNEKINEDSKIEPTVKVEEECADKISKPVLELKKAIIEDNSETNDNAYELVPTIQSEVMERVKVPLTLNEENNALVNNEVVTAESTQPIDQHKFDENQGEMKYEDAYQKNAIFEEVMVLENVDNNKNDLKHPEIKEELKYSSAEITDNDEEQSLFEIDNINEDSVTLADDSSAVLVELNTFLVGNDTIVMDSVQIMEKSDLDLINAQEKQKELKHALQLQKISVEEKVDEKNSVDVDAQKVLNESLTQNQSVSNDSTQNEESSHHLKQNIETNTSKSTDEELNLSSCIIVDDCKNAGEIFSESLKENIISESEVSNESGVDELKDNSDKMLAELETVQSIATKGRCIDEVQFSENNNLSDKNEQLKDLSCVENDLKERKCSFSFEENTALKNMEIVTADSTQIISHPTICPENVEENYVDQNKEIAECQNVVILENVDGLELNLPQSNDTVLKAKESNSNEDNVGFSEINVINHDAIKTDKQQSQVLTEEAIVNEEVVVVDNNHLQEPCDMKMENEKPTNNLVDDVEITENDVSEFPTSIDEAIEKPKHGKISTDEVKDELTGSMNTEEADVVAVHADNRESESVEHLNELPLQKECLPTDNDVDGKMTEITSFDGSIKENVQTINDANITLQQNDTIITESRDALNKEQSEENEKLKTEVENEPKTNTIESETANEMKTNQQINVSTIEENADLQDDVIFEDKIAELPEKETISTQVIESKSHFVEQLATNQTECITVENACVLKQDDQNRIREIKEHAQVEHELNIAAIGNIVMDYDSVKENPTNEDDRIKSIGKAAIITVNEHAKEIMTENVNVLKAPEECFTTREETVAINEDLDRSLEKSMILVIDSSNEERANTDESNSTEKSNTNDLILKVERGEEINEKLQQSSETSQPVEPLVTSTVISDPFKDTIISDNKISISDASNKGINMEKIDTKLESEMTEENSTPNVLKNENDKILEVKENLILNVNESKNQNNMHADAQETNQENDIEKQGSKKKKSSLQSQTKKSPSPEKSTEKMDKNLTTNVLLEEKAITNTDVEEDKMTFKTEVSDKVDNEPQAKIDDETCQNQLEISNSEKNVKEAAEIKEETKKKETSRVEKSPSPDKSITINDKDYKNNKKIANEINTDVNIVDKIMTSETELQSKIENDLQSAVEDDQSLKQNTVIKKIENVEPDLNKSKINTFEQDTFEINDHKETNQLNSEIDNHIEKTDKNKRGSKKKRTSPQPQSERSPTPDKLIKITNKDTKINQPTEEKVKIETNIAENTTPSKTELLDKVENKSQDEVKDEKETKTSKIYDENKNTEEPGNNKRGSKKKKTSSQPQTPKSTSPEKLIEVTRKDDKTDQQQTEEKSKIKTTDIDKDEIVSKTDLLIKLENKLQNETKDEQSESKTEISDKDKCIEDSDNSKRGSKKKKTSIQPQTKKSPSPEKSTKITEKADKIDRQIEENTKTENDFVENKTASKTNLSSKSENEFRREAKDERDERKSEKSDQDKCIEEPDYCKRGSKKRKTSAQSQTKKSPSPEKSTDIAKKDNKVDREIVEMAKTEINVVEDKTASKTTSKTDSSSKSENELQAETKDERHEKKSEISDKDKCIEEPDNNKRGSKKKKTSAQSETKKSSSPEKSTKITKKDDKIDQKIEEKVKTESDIVKQKTVSQTCLLSKSENELQAETKDERDERKLEISDQDKCIEETDNSKRGSKKKKTSTQPQTKKSPSPEKSTKITEKNDKIEEKAKTENDFVKDKTTSKTDLSSKSENELQGEAKDKRDETKSEKSDQDKCIDELDSSKRGSKKKKTSAQPQTKKSSSPEKSTEITEKDDKIDRQVEEKVKSEIDVVEEKTASKTDLSSKSENELQSEAKDERDERKSEISDKDKSIKESDNSKRGSKKKKTSAQSETKKSPSPEKPTEITKKEDKTDGQIEEKAKTQTTVEEKSGVSSKLQKGEFKDESSENKSETCDKEKTLEELGDSERGSKKKKTSTRRQTKKSPSPEKSTGITEKGDNGDRRIGERRKSEISEYQTVSQNELKCEFENELQDGEAKGRPGENRPEMADEVKRVVEEPGNRERGSSTKKKSSRLGEKRRSSDRSTGVIEKDVHDRVHRQTGEKSNTKSDDRIDFENGSLEGEVRDEIGRGDEGAERGTRPREKPSGPRPNEGTARRRDGATQSGGRERADVRTVVTEVDETYRRLDVTDAWPDRRSYCRSPTPDRRQWHSFSAGRRETSAGPCRRSTAGPYRRSTASPCRLSTAASPYRRSTASPCRRTVTAGRSTAAAPYRRSSFDWLRTEPGPNRTEQRPFATLHFCVRLVDRTASSGTGVKFWCTVVGHPEPRVQWYREGERLDGGLSAYGRSAGRCRARYTDGLAQLYVDDVRGCDSGQYTCVASNGRDRISTTGFLTVYTSPSAFGARTPPPVAQSIVDRSTISSTWHGRSSRSDLDLFQWSTTQRGPRFLTGMIADDVATYGGTIALQVRVQGYPAPYVTWSRDSRPLPRLSGKYIYLNDTGGLHTLLVNDSTARDEGTYVCRACNLYGSADAAKTIRVVSVVECSGRMTGVKPAIIVSRPADRLNVAVGEDIVVTLRVAGEPKPKVIWMRGSRDVTFHDRSLKETVNDYVKLSIKKAQPSDAGTYFIIAKNVYGSDRAFVTVGVRNRARSLTPPRVRNTTFRWSAVLGGCVYNEVPGPVRSAPRVSDRDNNRITLTWEKPETPETVLLYKVEAQSSEEHCWRQLGMTPTSTMDIYNLKPGFRYKFRVTARNRYGWGESVDSVDYVDVLEPKYLPEFRQQLPGQTKILLHHSATLQCHVRGSPRPRVTWFKDGEPLRAGAAAATFGPTDRLGECALTIGDATDSDAGRYACEAVNECGRVCTFTVVEVIGNRRVVEAERRLQGCLMKNNDFKESAPIFTKRLIDRRVEVNSTVRLSCQVYGLPVPAVMWYKDGEPLDFAGTAEPDRDSDNFVTLELTDVKYGDGGVYSAVASNAVGTASTRCALQVVAKGVRIRGPEAPVFVFGLPPRLESADSIVLNARVQAFRPVNVEWFRNDVRLRNGRRVDIIVDHDGGLELRIACVTKRDSGTYTLTVSNDSGTIVSRCDVTVVDRKHDDTALEQISLTNQLYSKKPKFVVKPKFQEVEEGQQVVIDSEIVGDPLPKITWLRDGLKPEYYRDNSEFLCVSDGNRYQLRIPHARLTHTGTYTLLAANPHGQIKALISLQVYSAGHCKKKIMENGSNRATVERLPRISRGLVDIECSENDSVAFECKLNITQETDVRWKKDGKLVRLGKDIKSELVNGDTARLEISAVGPLHTGLYTCTAYNELGEDSTSALLTISGSPQTKSAAPPNGQKNTVLGSPILAGETDWGSSKRPKRSSAPKFYAVLHDKIADVGDTVRFRCSVSGHPPPWSSWEKDGRPIGVNGRIRVREDDDRRSMEICDVVPGDAGLYRITVENKFGKIQAEARLEVLAHRHQTNDVQIASPAAAANTNTNINGRRQSGSAACAGENFTLSCDIRGNSTSDVAWYKDDERLTQGGRVAWHRDELAARLSISNLELTDAGVYTCVARCASGVTRCSAELSVFDAKLAKDSCLLQPPIFVRGVVPPERAVVEGEPVELTVKLEGAVPMSAKWFKDDVLVPDCGDFTYVVGDNGEFGLTITDPFNTDSGTYSCRVLNSFGEAMSSGKLVVNELASGSLPTSAQQQVADAAIEPVAGGVNVRVNDGPTTAATNGSAELAATILWGPCDTTVLRGARVVLETSYAGNPEPRIQWLRAGKTLQSDGHLCIANADGISSLTIDSITADDCGKYVVRVDNGLGNDYHFASVAVEGPPDPPAGRPVVAVSETSADVTWSSPAYDGGCMVTGYSVEVRPFNQPDWKVVADKCHSLSHIVRGLAAGESYVFRVRAENMHGLSDASLESIPVYILQTDYGNTVVPKKVNIENGELFMQQYERLDELGKGRYGVVYKVKERESSKFYAAKFVRCIKSKDKEKAQEEVDVMNCLRHPKLLQLDAAFEYPREVIMVTEYISGGELFERVVADDFTLTEKDCILFTRQICEGVDYMHKQNVVHLDLKPENIMCQSRTSHQIKLIDFGLAQKIQPGKPIRVLFGTPEFIPPEIISYEPIGLESDMWSVGVICYVLLSGLSPFMGDNDAETFTNITKAEFDFDDEAFDAISQNVKDFISALLVKRKEKRLTAKECLKHKWLAQQDMDMSCVILSTDKLKKFIIRRKWQVPATATAAARRIG